MTCTKCSAEFDDSFSFCPKCGAPAVKSEPVTPGTDVQEPSAPAYAQPEPQPVYSQPEPAYAEPAADPAEIQAPAKESFFKAPTKSAKSFAALFTAFTLVPAIFWIMIDYIIDFQVDGPITKYAVGLLVVVWICAVLPAIRVTPAPVTALICFLAVASYVFFVIKEISGSMEWFTTVALPMLLILAVFIGLDSAIAANSTARLFMPGIIAGEASIFTLIGGFLWTNFLGLDHTQWQLRAAIFIAASLLMLAVVLVAVSYVKKVNSSK